jgi:hypothetical protein
MEDGRRGHGAEPGLQSGVARTDPGVEMRVTGNPNRHAITPKEARSGRIVQAFNRVRDGAHHHERAQRTIHRERQVGGCVSPSQLRDRGHREEQVPEGPREEHHDARV